MKIEIKAEVVAEAYKALKTTLTQKERDIITRYYGIAPNVRHSLAELGEIYDITRERVRQIKVIALQKLKVQK